MTSKSTTERGLGHRHQTQRRSLLYNHKDGTPCWWCGKPMYRDKTKNCDGQVLEADHTIPRSKAGPNNLADRLLHTTCNRQRGAGDRDHLRPALQPPKTKPSPASKATPFTWANVS